MLQRQMFGSPAVSLPHPVPGFEHGGVTDIHCGHDHSALITVAGDLMTFGSGKYHKLGHGGEAQLSTPTVVEVLTALMRCDS